jgi:CBS domain-containing protein
MTASHPRQRTYIGPSFANARVSDAMRVGVITCRPDTSLEDAARMMSGYGVHLLIVARDAEDHRSWSAVDALDIAMAEARGRAATIGELADEELVTIDADAPLEAAARLMAERRTSHLVAVQPGDDRPVGVLGAAGLAAVLAWGGS